MRPALRFLDAELCQRIVAEARALLCRLGVRVHHAGAVSLLADAGAEVDGDRVRLNEALIDRALASAPRGFSLYDRRGERALQLEGDRVHFTPGSAAIHLLDPDTRRMRPPGTADYVRYAKLVQQLPHLAAQSTAFIPADVPAPISDAYRLYLSLRLGAKPVVTGAFSAEGYPLLRDLLLAVRGDARALADRPLAMLTCCPTSPLQWSQASAQNLIDCARDRVPAEIVAMPLAGFLAPVTLVGTLVAHTAETLSGVVLHQCAGPGAPLLYGGSTAIFDVRYETTPMGAVETQMLACAGAEIGKHLGLPVQAYIGLSDSKQLDAQAGLESASGATLAALAGVNSVSGPGLHAFENAFSLEKLVVDDEICGQALRLVQGIAPREDFPALPRFEELLAEGHLLISEHSRRHLRAEQRFPGPVIDRASQARWEEEGCLSLRQRARAEVERLVAEYRAPPLAPEVEAALVERMSAAARQHGMEALPGVDDVRAR